MAEMEAMISRGEFIEYARVHDKIYGTSVAGVRAVSAAGKTCLLDIDVQGATSVKKTDLNARFVFIAPPSFQELEARLRGRGTESDEQIDTRLQNAKGEMDSLERKGFYVRCAIDIVAPAAGRAAAPRAARCTFCPPTPPV